MSGEFSREIDKRQLLTLAKLVPHPHMPHSILYRIIRRFEENFLGKSLPEKIRFTKYAFVWVLGKIAKKLSARWPFARKFPRAEEAGLLRVAVNGTGSLGDFLTHTMFVEQFFRTFGPFNIDFYCHPTKVEEARFIFQNARFVRNVINVAQLANLRQHYDLIIDISYLVKFEILNSKRVLDHKPEFLNAIATADRRFEQYAVYHHKHPFLDGLFARHMQLQEMNVADSVGYFGNVAVSRASIPFLCPDDSQQDVLAKFGLVGRRYITVHDGFDRSYQPMSERVTKCWPLELWRDFVGLFKTRFPDILVVQLGAKNSGRIEGADLNLIGRTTLDEASWILKHSLLHIDGESGLVRLARALHTKAVVLFGPTSSSFFSFDRNINMVAPACHDCWWSTQDWLSFCPRELPLPECMASITPEQVLERVSEYLISRRSNSYAVVASGLYDQPGIRNQNVGVLADIFHRLNLPALPINEHSAEASSGIYLHASKQWEYLFAWSMIEAHRKSGDEPLRIADIGGGRGALSPYLAKRNFNVEVIDVDYLWDNGGDPSVETRFLKWAEQNGLTARYGSMFNIPAEDESYDIVLSISVAEHVLHKNFAIKEALRVLKPGGLLVMTFDFALDAQPNEDALRREIFTPLRLNEALSELGVEGDIFSPEEIRTSIAHIHFDGVRGIPDQMTVAALVLAKSQSVASGNYQSEADSRNLPYVRQKKIINEMLENFRS